MRTVVALLLLVPAAAAFGSLPPGASPHDDITEAAAKAVDWPESGRASLKEAVRSPDLQDFRPEADAQDGGRIDATGDFDLAHHCDRVPPVDNATAFEETVAYVEQERNEAFRLIGAEDAEAAVAALGRALHAAQDCFSHSNWVDLPPQAQDQFMAAILHGGQGPPDLVLTAFDPHSEDTTDPDDPYPHDTYAKDAPDKNNESQIMMGDRTKYEHARDGAIQASAAIMAEFLGPLNETQRSDLAALRATDGVGSPGPWLATGVVALLAAAVLRRH